MDCPFCGKRMKMAKTENKNLRGSAPYLTVNYVCHRTVECSAVLQFDMTYKKTLSPSGYGHIDSGGKVIQYLPQLPPELAKR